MFNGIVFLLLAGIAVTGTVVFRVRRFQADRRRASERDIVYTNLAHRQQLTHLQDMAPPHVRDRVRAFGGNSEVNNVLLGKDIDGTYYVARTGAIGADEPVLLFEAKRATRLDGLHIERPRPTSPIGWRAYLPSTQVVLHSDSLATRMRWDIQKSTEVDDSSMAVAGRIFQHCREESASHAKLDLAVTIRRGQVLIHCNGPLQLSMAGEFIDRARRLRTLILECLNNAGTTRWNNSRSEQTVDLGAINRIVDQLSPAGIADQSPHSGALGSLDEVLDGALSRETSVTR